MKVGEVSEAMMAGGVNEQEPDEEEERNDDGTNVEPPLAPIQNDETETGVSESNDSDNESDEFEMGCCVECGDLGQVGSYCLQCEDSGMIYQSYDPGNINDDDIPREEVEESEEEEE
jgi:hypothetical protein